MDEDTTVTDGPPTDETPPVPPPPRERRLERSRSERWLTGVCGGLGAYFGLDPILFRIAFIVLTVAGGAGVWLYLAAWLLLPEEGSKTSLAHHAFSNRRGFATIVAVVLIAIGVGNLTSEIHFFRGGRVVWALLLIGGGIYIFRSTSGDRPVPGEPYTPTPPATTAWPTPATPTPAPPAFTPPPAAPPPEAPTAPMGWTTPPPPHRPRGRSITPYVISSLLVAGGAAAFLDTADVVHVSPVPLLATFVLVTGLSLLATARWGRGRGLIPVGVLLALALGVAATADSLHVPFRGGVGDRQWRPTALSDVRPVYRLRMGTMTIDLTAVPFAGADRTITATVGAGELVVLAPEGAAIDVDARAGIGAVQLFGRPESGGVSVERSASVAGSSPDAGHITLRLKTGVGRVEVNRQVNLRMRQDAALDPELEAPRAAA